MTTATLLTPPGTGAIAVIAMEGPQAWAILRGLFSKPLPLKALVNHFWYGQLAGDDVIVAVIDAEHFEIHCHGGVRVVEWIQSELRKAGCEIEPKPNRRDEWAWIERAPTLRTAGILLDQMLGAFEREVEAILNHFCLDRLAALANLAPLGQHLIEPWKVVIAGVPNVGKSSLINALVGFERAVVSPVAGTTRDVVATVAAFEGWPVALLDTAGLRSSDDSLEAEGVARARKVLDEAEVIVWVIDATAAFEPPSVSPTIFVANKCDLALAVVPPGAIAICATSGLGVPALIAAIVRVIVPVLPEPGAAVPYTPGLAARIVEAHTTATAGNVIAARRILESCLAICHGDGEALEIASPERR